MKLFYLEFPAYKAPSMLSHVEPTLIATKDDCKVSIEQIKQIIVDNCDQDPGEIRIVGYNNPDAIKDDQTDARQGYVLDFTCDLGGGQITFSGPLPCYCMGDDKHVIQRILPNMIPQVIQNEVLIRWNSRAMSQGYPIPQKDGTFGKPTKANMEAAERELCWFFGATACYDALCGALETGKTSAQPVWVFPVMQGHSIAWAMDNNL